MFDPSDPNRNNVQGGAFPFPFQLGDGVVIQPTFTLVDMIKASMQAVATSIQTDPRFKDGLMGDMRKKFLAVLRWLHAVACVANNEELSTEVTKIAAVSTSLSFINLFNNSEIYLFIICTLKKKLHILRKLTNPIDVFVFLSFFIHVEFLTH